MGLRTARGVVHSPPSRASDTPAWGMRTCIPSITQLKHKMYEPDADDPEDENPLMLMDPLHPAYEYNRECQRQKYLLIIRRRRLRDESDPFDVTYAAFKKVCRLSQDLVFSVIDLIRPFMRRRSSPLAAPLELKVLSVLSFYATGSYQSPTGRQYDCPIAQPTLSAYIEEVTNALNEDEILGRLIRFPINVQELNYIIERNQALGGQIPDVAGYTDGTLVKVVKPSLANNPQAFIGRKRVPCINVQITCDRRLYVTNVLANFPGATNDSFIFSGCGLRLRMYRLFHERRCHLLGDSGYALEPWMIVPFEQPQEDTPEGRFNKVHSRDRNVVERCIGNIKERFRCIHDERVAHYDYIKASKFVNAVVVLHNICVLANLPGYIDENEQ
ncbi:putative nuclease HARBI1 [Thrips palmi]|uniref:Nuclease HARBI1 n=1 Tax=Thrips palmi TaxID=161013 RepID=A0A6P8YZA5_THRPL|nr:putative nuclease HARBI1 [Thrips palmi]